MYKDGDPKIVGKEEIKEALGRSRDAGDIFMMGTTGTHEQATAAMNGRPMPRKIVQRSI